MIDFPDWYDGGFDDLELVVKCLFEKHFDGCSPAIPVYAWLPDTWRDSLPLVCLARVPGAVTEDDQFDTGEVQVFCMADSRSDAWAIAEFVRQIMGAYRKGGMVDVGAYRANVKCIERSEGPQLSMEEDALSERTVPLSFRVTTRRRSSLPDYERVLK